MERVEHWTGAATCELVAKSYLWLVGVTAPATALLAWLVTSIPSGTFVDSLDSGLWFFVIFLIVFGILALGGAVVALPFTHFLGRGLRRVRSRHTHVLAHAVLAGTLAAISMQIILFVFEDDDWTWQYPLLLAAPAGVAAAIGRWRLDIEKPSPIAGTAKPEPVDGAAE